MAESKSTETKDTGEAKGKDKDRPYVWVPADHVATVEPKDAHIAVDAETGAVLDPQPEYPKHEAPEPEPLQTVHPDQPKASETDPKSKQ